MRISARKWIASTKRVSAKPVPCSYVFFLFFLFFCLSGVPAVWCVSCVCVWVGEWMYMGVWVCWCVSVCVCRFLYEAVGHFCVRARVCACVCCMGASEHGREKVENTFYMCRVQKATCEGACVCVNVPCPYVFLFLFFLFLSFVSAMYQLCGENVPTHAHTHTHQQILSHTHNTHIHIHNTHTHTL